MDHGSDSLLPADFLLGALRQLGKRDLTFTQLVAMDYIARSDEPNVAEVSAAIDRSRAATSRLVDDLVRAGLVDRRSSDPDRRVKRLRLTRAAKDLLSGLHKAHHDRVMPRPQHQGR